MLKDLSVIILLLLLSCSKTNETQILEENNVEKMKMVEYSHEKINDELDSSNLPVFLSDIKNIMNGYLSGTGIINLSLQEGIYKILFDQKKLNEVLEFRDFVEPKTDDFTDNKTKIAFNPVLMAIDFYPNTLNELYIKRPDLFLMGHEILPGEFSVSPIIYIFRSSNGTLYNRKMALEFFFDNGIEWEKSKELYGTRNRGGNEYVFAGTLLTESEHPTFQEYLIGKGFETESDISGSHIMVWSKGCNVYEQPGFGNKVIFRLDNNIKINPIKITLYKKDGYQWIYFMYDEDQYGWIAQDQYIRYDTGA